MTPNQSFQQSLEIKHDQLMDKMVDLCMRDFVPFRRLRVRRIDLRLQGIRAALSMMAMQEVQSYKPKLKGDIQ